MLLDQAAESFQRYAYAETLPHITEFSYRIISGDPGHDRMIDITPSDNILIVGKDSVGRNLKRLDKWLENEQEIYLVVDEAHHSTAKTYRKIFSYVRERVPNVKLIGLTATPFRTAENEKGLLSKIYCDGVNSCGRVVKNDKGIAYQIGLKELINMQILSKPIFESYYSDADFGDTIGIDALERIQQFDVIPDDIAKGMADNAPRNKLIVDTYLAKKKAYGQTIVFAVNVLHAIALSALFNKAGVRADFVVSGIKDTITGITYSTEDNQNKIQKYRNGELDVLVNVNILTEGADIPQTKTVFLARPTVSSILMTQMVGRALRGPSAGGTADAYIVSFVDRWNEHIAWVNPETLFTGNNDFAESASEYLNKAIRTIAISKIEEFAAILDDSVNTDSLEAVPFIQRIPVGMYAFSYLQKNGMDLSYQVMVYDSTQKSYENMMEALPELFSAYNAEDEYLSEDTLAGLEEQCRDAFFCGEMIPPYESRDVISILKYYAQNGEIPNFYTFAEIDRSRIDIAKIARHIWEEDMGPKRKSEYSNELWDNGDDNILKLFFGKKIYFLKQLDIELTKISNPELYNETKGNIIYDEKPLEEMTLHEIGKINPNMEKALRDAAFEKSRNEKGEYCCAQCGKTGKTKIPFQVDHIKAMNNGGKSTPDNLQILCKRCNGIKGDS